MHIDLDIALQKMDSNVYANLQQEEKDYALNKALLRFINQRLYSKSNKYGKGYEDTLKRLEDLEGLKSTATITPVFSSTGKLLVQLPQDLLYIVEAEATIFHDCGRDITYEETETTTEVAQMLLEYSNKYENSSVTSFSEFDITVAGTSILTTGFKNTRSLYGFPQDLYNFVLDVVSDINEGSSGYTAYWESYQGTFAKNTLFLVASSLTTFVLVYKTTGGTVSTSVISAPFSYTTIDVVASDGEELAAPIRIADQELRSRLQKNPFRKSKFTSPLATVSGGVMTVYTDSTFTITEVELQYIRQPRKLSHSLGQDSELRPHTDPEIVDMAVSHILEILQSPRYQTQLIDSTKQE